MVAVFSSEGGMVSFLTSVLQEVMLKVSSSIMSFFIMEINIITLLNQKKLLTKP